MRKVLSTIKKDMIQITPAIIPVLLYCISAQLLFHAICPLVLLTGYPCPACGMSRAFLFLLSGRWDLAGSYNIMVIPWLLLAVYFIVSRYFVKIRPLLGELLLCAVCIMTIAYYIYRMIRVYPSGPVMVYHEKNLLAFIRSSL